MCIFPRIGISGYPGGHDLKIQLPMQLSPRARLLTRSACRPSPWPGSSWGLSQCRPWAQQVRWQRSGGDSASKMP